MHDWEVIEGSSHVAAVSWEVEGTIICAIPAYEFGTLYVAFKNGKVYAYEGVSRADYRAIYTANSVGGALHRLGVTHPMGRRHKLVGRYDPKTGVAEPSR